MNETLINNISEIDAAEWTQIFNSFDEISALSANKQSQYLDQIHLSNAAEVMLKKMLDAQHESNMLDQTIDPLVEALLGEDATNENINPADIMGRDFGVWKALKPLGAGGMGQVFLAERADGQYKKQVALKVIKSGQFSELSQQRFLAEMQILAQLEHPHIAHLIDGGTSEDGITYFVMELINGEPIVDYANAHKLSLNERIKLILQVIDAVEYAHQNLVIHGDIKPANILVNDSGQVKLVDFGVARSLGDDNHAYLPQFTPSYSAPEQAQGQALTTASDVFGLSAVLYELCTGSSPRINDSLTTHAELQEKLNTPITAAFVNFQAIQAQNKIKSRTIRYKYFGTALSQELGAIIDKGLQIAVVDRYKNTAELRRDLLLYIEGSAVPSYSNQSLYRWRKFFIKHKWPASLYALALVIITTTAMIAFNQARLGQQEADKANWTNQFLLSIFEQADPIQNQQKPITVNELTAQAAEQIMKDDSDISLKSTSLATLSQIQFNLGEVESAEKLITEQIKLLEKLSVKNAELAAVHIKAGNILESQDNLEEAIAHYRKAEQLAPLSNHLNESSIRANLALANSLLRLNKSIEAEELVQRLMLNQNRILNLPQADSLLATLYAVKANILLNKKQFSAAIEQLNKAKKKALKLSDEPLLYPHILGIESDTYYESGQLDKAVLADRELVEYFSRNLGENHPETIDQLGRLAVTLAALGDLEAAININQTIINNTKGTEIKNHQMPAAYLNLGTAYQASGEDIKAIENYQKALALWPELKPRITVYEASTEARMAQSYLNLKKYDESQRLFKKALQKVSEEYGVNSALFARFQIMYASLLLELKKLEEASSVIPSAHQVLVDSYGEQSKNAAIANLRWAQLNVMLGQFDLAVKQANSVVKVLDVSAYRKRNQDLIILAKKIMQSGGKKALLETP